MTFILEKDDLSAYLGSSEIIDYDDPKLEVIANSLSAGIMDEVELAKRVYEFVRDKISHSFDVNGQVVTCIASEVLTEKQGICYAKSHLLAAILRRLGIPTGFCYQRLIFDDIERPWLVLHGLNAIYLSKLGKWIRVDSRGNKEGIHAEFLLEGEKLAYDVRKEFSEEDIPIIFSEPNANVVEALRKSNTVDELMFNLPSMID